jgi:hypothetical protein
MTAWKTPSKNSGGAILIKMTEKWKGCWREVGGSAKSGGEPTFPTLSRSQFIVISVEKAFNAKSNRGTPKSQGQEGGLAPAPGGRLF